MLRFLARLRPHKIVLMSTAAAITCSRKNVILCEGTSSKFIAEPKELSNTFLLRQSAARSVDSSILVLSTSLDCYLTAQLQYRQCIESSIDLLTTALEVSQMVVENLGVEEQLSKIKAEMFTQKAAVCDSFYIYEESCKMLNLSSSLSFLVGNEVSSGLALTHLHNVSQEVMEH